MNKEIVYVISGHHNSNYEGIFAHVFDSADKMVNKAKELMACDMNMELDDFNKLYENNRGEFNEQFLDGGERTLEECLKEGAYYSEKGYEMSWGKKEIQ